MSTRTARVARATTETKINVVLTIDGKGTYSIRTGVAFFDHMLELFAKHGGFDLTIKASGDTQVDDHHTVEDVGLCLGDAFARALRQKTGIRRYGHFLLPMDEALAEIALDLSGRPFLVFDATWQQEQVKLFDVTLVEEFWRAFATRAQITLHIRVRAGKDAHHVSEAVFKGVARALAMAVERDPRCSGVPSTKGTLTT